MRRERALLFDILVGFGLSDGRAQATDAQWIQRLIQRIVDDVTQWIGDDEDHSYQGNDRRLFLSVGAGEKDLVEREYVEDRILRLAGNILGSVPSTLD